MIQSNIDILEEAVVSRRRLNRDVARSLVECGIDASQAACDAIGIPPGSSWGEVAKRALFEEIALSGRRPRTQATPVFHRERKLPTSL
jgi:hypothetical protein